MNKYLVQVTIYVEHEVEAMDEDDAVNMVRNMDISEFFHDDWESWPKDYEITQV